MNHDATHCLDWGKSCPSGCYRAQLTAELKDIHYPLPVSWTHYKNTEECMIGKRCYECKYLSETRCSIGRLCIADKPWRTDISRWKVQSGKACKFFEPNGLKWEDHMKEAANVKAGKKTDGIVRCGECVWLYLHDGCTGVCENRFGLNGVVSPRSYCSNGKRRETYTESEETK